MKVEQPAAIAVVEMQNDLVAHPEPRGLQGALTRAVTKGQVIQRLTNVLGTCRANNIQVLFLTKERHPGLEQPDFPPIYRSGGDEPILVHGTWGAQVVDALKPEPSDIVLPRFTSIDPSHGSELWSVLERLKTRTLIVAGVSTTFAVEGTVRAAANRGYRVVVLEDCCAGAPREWHEFSARNILPLLSEVVSSDDLIAALV